jgi:hypothetical protein
MDKHKIGSMFNKFLVDLFLDEMVEEELAEQEVVEAQADLDEPELFEEPEEGWDNPYDDFMFSLANHIMEEYGFGRETAMECILTPAALFVERKHLPPLPKGEVEEETLAKWVEAAESINFDEHVIGIVDRLMTEAVAEVQAEASNGDIGTDSDE